MSGRTSHIREAQASFRVINSFNDLNFYLEREIVDHSPHLRHQALDALGGKIVSFLEEQVMRLSVTLCQDNDRGRLNVEREGR